MKKEVKKEKTFANLFEARKTKVEKAGTKATLSVLLYMN